MDVTAMKFLLHGLADIDAYRSQLKNAEAHSKRTASRGSESGSSGDSGTEAVSGALSGAVSEADLSTDVSTILSLRENLTAQLVYLRCENTLRTLDQSVQTLFTPFSATTDCMSVPSLSSLLLPHVSDPSLMLRKTLIIAAECAWDAQLWSLRSQGREVRYCMLLHGTVTGAILGNMIR